MKRCKRTKKLIIHADDFGLSEKVNEGIKKAFLQGALTSTSIMANAPCFEHAAAIYHELDNLDVGIHITLIEEKPILSPSMVASLLGNDLHFHQNASIFTQKLFLREISLAQIRDEIEAQFRKIIDHGIRISHIDSHQHLHILPKIRRIVIELADKYCIPSIRIPLEKISLNNVRYPVKFKRFLQLFIVNCFSSYGNWGSLHHSDSFFGFLFGGRLHKSNLSLILNHLPAEGISEIMCHPGIEDPTSKYSHWNYLWGRELSALTDRDIADTIKKNNIELISYQDLAKP